jgi:Uma2 family endonuclease
MLALAAPPGQNVLLQGVSWRLYDQMLADVGDSHSVHLAFDNGLLEISVLTPYHEVPNRILSILVEVVCLEKGISALNFGSATLRSEAALKGCEPDTAFYIQSEPAVRGRLAINLEFDPPPDLVIEVDYTSPSLSKLPIYASLGVPEVWLSEGRQVEFYKLVRNSYRKVRHSLALPFLDRETVAGFLQSGLAEERIKWLRQVQEWARGAVK